VLALIAEIPTVVFGVLNLNDAWNFMFDGTALTILSIAAARMYRSLTDRGPFTGPSPPRFSPGAPNPTALCRGTEDHGPMHIVSVTQLEGTQMPYKATAFSPTDEIQVEFVTGGSISSLAPENTHDRPHTRWGSQV